MIKRIFITFGVLLIGLIAVLLFNTFRFNPASESSKPSVAINKYDSAALHLSQALQIKTVSFGDTLPIDTAEFIKFRTFMETTYPLMHQKLEKKSFNLFSYVFTWKGKDTTLAPYVLMAHTDVVPVEAIAESKWSYPSFSGTIDKDTIWGRGAVDDKGSAIAIMEAVELSLQENIQPNRTIYLCFGHDEEISGKRGAAIFSKWFDSSNIKPALVLDEGGMVDTEKFKATGRPVAVVGTGEKGYTNIDLTVEIPGGHSSTPMKETAIDILNKAIVKVRAKQMPALIAPPVQDLLNRTSAGESFFTKMEMANMWLFKGSVIKKMEASNQTNAMVHTTLVPTIVKAGIKDNVIPSIAKATFNSRILPGQTSDDVVAFVIKAINDERVIVKKQTISLFEASATTSADHPTFKKIEGLTQQVLPNVLVSPYLVVGATDSRYFRPFSESVLNFSPMQNVKGFHGIDERLGKEDLNRMITFYKLFIQE